MAVRNFRPLAAPALALTLCASGAAGCEPRQQPGGASARARTGAGANVQQQQQQQPAGQAPAAKPATGGEGGKTVADGELRTLGAGGYSKVTEPFVFVARDAQSYKELRGLASDLPELNDDFFRANAVVAAFLGQRRSGGYAVEIARGSDGALRVSERTPPKDAMTTMALTAPYSVVSSAWPEENPVRLNLDAAWRQGQRPYRVVLGQFTMMGGFAGVREQFNVTGSLGLMRYKDLATVLFDLGGDDKRRPRALNDAASGRVSSDKLLLTVDPGTFILPPRGRMKAEVGLGPGENKLHFALDGMQTAVADGFGGRGEFDAEATAGPPKKLALEDDPE